MSTEVPIEYGGYYHIYNRGVNGCDLFAEPENYQYFLQLYKKYIPIVADTFCYCLLGNHFHLLVRIKEEKEIFTEENLSGLKRPDRFQIPHRPSQQFSNLFNAYTKVFNQWNKRSGTLFQRPFQRVLIEREEYFRYLVYYIHHNPVHHGFVERMKDWNWSSYKAYLSSKSSSLKREEVIEWFDDLENMIFFHQHHHSLSGISELIVE